MRMFTKQNGVTEQHTDLHTLFPSCIQEGVRRQTQGPKGSLHMASLKRYLWDSKQ